MRQDGCAEFISASLRIVPSKKTPVWASFLILPAAPAEAGGSPLCRTPAGGGESVHIFRGRKRVLVLGKVRADGALTRRVSAAGCCTAQSASVPCAFRDAVGCFNHCVLHGEVWWRSLPPAPRSSALRHGPPMPRRGAGVVFEFSSQGVSIPCFGLCVRIHTEGGVQPLCSSAPEPGVESLPLPEQPLFWCIFSVFAPTTAYAVPLPRSRRGG